MSIRTADDILRDCADGRYSFSWDASGNTLFSNTCIAFIAACRDFGRSQLQMFQDDIQALAPVLIAKHGVSPECLDEIYRNHVH